MQALSDTVFSMQHKDIENIDIFHGWNFGDINKVIVQENLDLPFDKNKEYKIIQGFNGSFSHNDEYSMYAIDFNLKVNDTVRSADNGYVVGVVNQNKIFGNDKKFRDYSNFITIYNNKTGIYTQYVHLKFNGTFVKVGDQVKRGQAIAQTGLSGYMDGEHLHFNVLIPNNKSLQSIPINFENYKGADLKSGDKVKH